MNDKILITAATGKTGYAATVELLKEGYSVKIYVRSRNAKAIENSAPKLPSVRSIISGSGKTHWQT